jgi:ABC-2 type transport system ATP-binding protein
MMQSPADDRSGRKPAKRFPGLPAASRAKPSPTKKPSPAKNPLARTQSTVSTTVQPHVAEVGLAEFLEDVDARGAGEVDHVVDVVEVVEDVHVVELAEAGSAHKAVQRAEVLVVRALTKRFDDTIAVAGIDLTISAGSFYGIVGPNGAGKTTTLSMITGLLRPDGGTVMVNGADVWSDPARAKRQIGVLPDRLRLFDRLTGAQLLYYTGVLRGLSADAARSRAADLAAAFRIEDAMGRLVTDYSSGMTKKVALAAAMIHSPRLLVLDEPFESVDPVSAATVTEILRNYVEAGGTVLLSSHSMDLVQRICNHVAIVVEGAILADGTVDEVRGDGSLEERFIQLARGGRTVEELEWLHTFSD